MIKKDELLKFGYVSFSLDMALGISEEGDGFQKEVRDKKGIKYYINCKNGEEFEAILINPNSSLFTLTIKYWKSLSKIEKCIDDIWKANHCKYIEEFSKKQNLKYRQKDLLEQIAEEKLNAQK